MQLFNELYFANTQALGYALPFLMDLVSYFKSYTHFSMTYLACVAAIWLYSELGDVLAIKRYSRSTMQAVTAGLGLLIISSSFIEYNSYLNLAVQLGIAALVGIFYWHQKDFTETSWVSYITPFSQAVLFGVLNHFIGISSYLVDPTFGKIFSLIGLPLLWVYFWPLSDALANWFQRTPKRELPMLCVAAVGLTSLVVLTLSLGVASAQVPRASFLAYLQTGLVVSLFTFLGYAASRALKRDLQPIYPYQHHQGGPDRIKIIL